MIIRKFAVAAFAAALATSAFAQQSSGTSDAGSKDNPEASMPQGWAGDIGTAFYKDAMGSGLKTEAEVKEGFSALSAEKQAQVRSDCSVAKADSGAVDSGTTASTTPAPANEATDQRGMMNQVCMWVDGM